MPVICPKCSLVRPPDARNPDWQCPGCGICYTKFTGAPSEAPLMPTGPVVERQGVGLGWLFKIVLLVVLALILKALIERPRAVAPPDEAHLVQVEKARTPDPAIVLANATISASGVDSGMLHSLSGRLERACARNKYGLSESACIARIRGREDECAARTAQRHPGQVGNTDRMQVLAQAYVACIFEEG